MIQLIQHIVVPNFIYYALNSWPFVSLLSIIITLITFYNITQPNISKHHNKPRHKPHSRNRQLRPHHPPCDVSLSSATCSNHTTTFNSIYIPQHHWPPYLQHSRRQHIRASTKRQPNYKNAFRYLFLAMTLRASDAAPTYYHIPGSNHAFIKGATSLDQSRQEKYVKTILDNANKQNPANTCTNGNKCPCHINTSPIPPPASNDNNEPRIFIADTDSLNIIIDTGANRVIVNDAKQLKNFKAKDISVKGIDGRKTRSCGIGEFHMTLQSDTGKRTTIIFDDAVYVQQSTYNLLPP